jgi:hypothetical protein
MQLPKPNHLKMKVTCNAFDQVSLGNFLNQVAPRRNFEAPTTVLKEHPFA